MAVSPIGPGSLLASRFRLEDLLSDTSGARFWRATDLTLARSVAVHVVEAGDRRAPALLTAARASANIADSRLLRVLDAAEEDGVVYVVNEWGSGISLDRLLTDGPLPPRRAAWVVKEAADAIATAHRQGVAHGRLLPENVMVTEAGSVKLIGFVVDAVLHGRRESDGGREPLTDHESDVLNLGALLYACLLGKWPGTPGSALSEAPRDHGRVLRPRQVRAGVPKPLDCVCDELLNGPTGHGPRLESALDVSAALHEFLAGGAGSAPGVLGLEATTMLDRAELAAGVAAHRGAARDAAPTDPDATQAGRPLFADDRTTGWEPLERFPRTVEPERATGPVPPRSTGRPASDTRGGAGAAPRSTGMGAGDLPPTWGPDTEDERDPLPEPGSVQPGRGSMRLAVMVAFVLLLVLAVALAFSLGRDAGTPAAGPGGDGSGAPNRSAEPLRIAGVSDFDPQADPPSENPELAASAVDGDPSTGWRTSTYRGSPRLGNLKEGVGLLLDLGADRSVGSVVLTLVGQPYEIRLLAAPEGTTEAPVDLTGLSPAAAATQAGPEVTLQPDSPLTTRYLVVWLTSLPPASGGFTGEVAEITVRS